MKVLVALVMLMLVFNFCAGDARICYNCTGDCVTDSECKGSCMTITHELGEEVEVRTCSDEVQDVGCFAETRKGKKYKVCYCNTERCNGSSFVSVNLSLLLLTLFICFNN